MDKAEICAEIERRRIGLETASVRQFASAESRQKPTSH